MVVLLPRSDLPPGCLNESPSEKEGKYSANHDTAASVMAASMKVPPKRKGNDDLLFVVVVPFLASMKVPPKRKGNRERLEEGVDEP